MGDKLLASLYRQDLKIADVCKYMDFIRQPHSTKSVLSGKRYDLTLSFVIQIRVLCWKFSHFPNLDI